MAVISGNPYKFAVLGGVINEWNLDDIFGNGVLLICVNGDIYPKEIVAATLRCDQESAAGNGFGISPQLVSVAKGI